MHAEFWLRYLAFLHSEPNLPDIATVRTYALARASGTFCAARPELLLGACVLHERAGDIEAARALFRVAQQAAPQSIEVAMRFANFERRAGAGDTALQLVRTLLTEFQGTGDQATVVWLAQQLAVLEVAVARGSGPAAGEKEPPAAGGGQECGQEEDPTADASTGDTEAADGNVEAEAVLTQLLATSPGTEAAWSAALAVLEVKYTGGERAGKVLALCQQAVTATVETPGVLVEHLCRFLE